MNNKSIWDNFFDDSIFKPINKNIETDVAIIGGGITGLSIAYFLKSSNLDVCLFERNKIGAGITSKTTAKITYLEEGLISKIKNIYNKKVAYDYYSSQKHAINLLENIINENKIECDFKKVYSYYFATNQKDIQKIKEEETLIKSFNEDVRVVHNLPDGLKILYGITVPNTYIFNPIKYLNSIKNIIKNKINIYENSKVTKFDKIEDFYILKVNNFTVKAKYVVVSSHYPYFLFPYLMPLKCSLEKSYIGVFKTKEESNFSAISESNPVLSVRYLECNKDKYKLILTGSHNIINNLNEENNFKEICKKEPDYIWSNIDIMTKDSMPYIGSISKNLFIATGYNTWGMTNGTLAGEIISDKILKRENEYAKLFNPKRHNNLNTIIKYPLYAIFSSYALINSKINKNKSWYKNVTFKKINGINVGIYKDELGKNHIVKTNCPHLGCTLIFNSIEKTWDCPCHASRFDIDGNVISGPSNYDISFK